MNDVSRAHGAKDADAAEKQGIFARLVTFFQQVIAEFRKVQRPTRSELWSMFLTVIAFLLIVMAFVLVLDIAFSKSVFWIFG
ncbi:MAG: preprotein translocase subunit SecE [Actinomycetaceae bacterium]|nr:preprotein translocase subunit SecE [Arcanobacterium sp.]MDD7687665.1 preprotein translocase subunit SecE [Actinomycetaceae bacterium]MDY5272558.1 preprotein translocase subunit SecE [Arcanobacterium sp.]